MKQNCAADIIYNIYDNVKNSRTPFEARDKISMSFYVSQKLV